MNNLDYFGDYIYIHLVPKRKIPISTSPKKRCHLEDSVREIQQRTEVLEGENTALKTQMKELMEENHSLWLKNANLELELHSMKKILTTVQQDLSKMSRRVERRIP